MRPPEVALLPCGYTMCKVPETIVLTLPNPSDTVANRSAHLGPPTAKERDSCVGKLFLSPHFWACPEELSISAQNRSTPPFPNNIYCTGVVTTEAVPHDSYVITGEESNERVTFSENDFCLHKNRGSNQGAKNRGCFFGGSAFRGRR